MSVGDTLGNVKLNVLVHTLANTLKKVNGKKLATHCARRRLTHCSTSWLTH